MATQADFDQEMRSLYRSVGVKTGYWANYFLRSVRQEGGLAVAKKLLAKPTSNGFEKLEEVQRMDLSVEALVLANSYAHLFTPKELRTAQQRLAQVPGSSFPPKVFDGPATVGQIADGEIHQEGAVHRVSVDRYERDPKARAKCIEHHGTCCKVCELDFESRYGHIGKGFIHVHHLRPLGRLKSSYRLDPLKDLVPVCPNCHAMLHRRDPPFEVEQLRRYLRSTCSRR